MKTRRGLRVVFYEPAGRGGIALYTWELAEHLALSGNDVTVCTTSDYEISSWPRSFRAWYLFRRSRFLRWLRFVIPQSQARPASASTAMPETSAAQGRLRPLRIRMRHAAMLLRFRFQRPDIVHVQWLDDKQCDVDLIRRLKNLGIRVVFTAHDVPPRDQFAPETHAVLARLHRSVDRTIVHAEASRSLLIEQMGLNPADVAVVAHGCYEFGFTGRAIREGQTRRKLGISPQDKVILLFGLIKRYKGLEYLVSAFETVRSRRQDAHLLIVGDLYRGDPEAYAEYFKLLESLDGRPQVTIARGYVPIETIPEYFAASDIVALPYTEISQSGILMAAYGAGKPVVVSDVGGLGESVRTDGTGLIVPPRDVDALARAILALLEEPAAAAQMSERARRLCKTTYSWETVAARTEQVYREALREAPLASVSPFSMAHRRAGARQRRPGAAKGSRQ